MGGVGRSDAQAGVVGKACVALPGVALFRRGFVREHEVLFLAAVRRFLDLTLKATLGG